MQSVITEKAHIFFALLNVMYRIDAEQRLELIGIVSAPHMKKEDANSLIDRYEKQSRDIMEMIQSDNDYSGIEKLKKEM